MHRPSSIEVLENRIAPAVFFVSTNSLNVRTSAGEDAQDSLQETEARDLAGSTVAVLLSKGDILILDVDNDGQRSANDVVLAQIAGGKAMVFLTEGTGENRGGFGVDEITGLAVSSGFKGEIKTDVRGSVVTALDSTGALTASSDTGTIDVQPASISGLKVAGHINGWLLVGESISKVQIGAPLHGSENQYSVDTIATGTETNAVSVSLNGGSTTFGTVFEFAANKNGGNITDVQLANGAARIAAGDGADSSTPEAAGNGGSISKVRVTHSPFAVSLEAGNGGAAQGTGKSGSGGNLTDVRIVEDGANSNISFLAGHGGASLSGKGGVGGSVSSLDVKIVNAVASVTIHAGEGEGTGRGGSISKVRLTTDAISGNLSVEAGDGGSGIGRGSGGVGGSVADVEIFSRSVGGGTFISGGNGGNGGVDAGSGAGAGSVQKLQLKFVEDSGDLYLSGGSGGGSSSDFGAGGNGGTIAKVRIDVAGLNFGRISAGSGGSANDASAGKGGAVKDLTFVNTGNVSSDIQISGGGGGSVNEGTGRAGVGGAISGLKVVNGGGLKVVDVVSGSGGTFSESGKGGKSGQISNVTIDSSAEISGGITIHSAYAGGPWGPSDAATGNGETSGDVKNVVINDYFGASGIFSIYVGSGKNGKGDKAKGSSTGSISGVKLNAPQAYVRIGAPDTIGAAGGDGDKSVGGSGGNITKISGSVGILDIFAPEGGTGATGGRGGSISNVNITEVGSFVHLIAAGDGGSGTARAGAGGAVTKVKIAGDVGNFGAPFGLDPYDSSSPSASMGGLVAGMAGNGPGRVNGSVVNIAADRIAAILAGTPAAGSISAENAVGKIAAIRASVIGADVDGNTEFDFLDGNAEAGYQIGTSDSAIDGLVLAKAGRYKLPVTPLKLIVVGEEIL